MSTDIEPYRGELERRDVIDGWTGVIGDVSKLAAMIADTDFVPKPLRNKPAAVTAAILAGREVGIPPMRALQHMHMVDGRPTMSAEQKRAKALEAGHEIAYVETTTTRCVVKGRRAGSDEWVTVTWTMDDAKAAGLSGKDNYRKHPRRMLQARATGELCDLIFPDATGGLATWEQAVDDSDAPTAASNGHAEVKATARRRTAVTAKAARPADVDGEVVEQPELPPLPGEDGYDEPVAAPAPSPAITRSQRDKVMALFGDLEVTDRAERLDLSSRIVNRQLASANDLTRDDASALIDVLENALMHDHPLAWLRDVSGQSDEWPPVAEQAP